MTNTLDTGLVTASSASASAGASPENGAYCNSGDTPAWRQTGTSSSSQIAHTGSYSGPLTWGTERRCIGRAGKTTPLWPLATARLISPTVASVGQIGTMHCG